MGKVDTTYLVIVLLLVAPIVAINPKSLSPFLNMGSQVSVMDFDIVNEGYMKLNQDFYALATRMSTKSVEGLVILPKQTGNSLYPPEWILVDLIAPNGATTLALRNDNCYVVAYTNATHDWHSFANREDLIPGSVRLPFDGDYTDVGIGSRGNILNIALGRTATIQAVNMLLTFNDFAVDLSSLKVALTTLILTISEAARFSTIRGIIRDGWETQSRITKPDHLVYWAKLSCELARGWSTKDARRYEQLLELANGKEDAKSMLNMMIYGKKCEDVIDNLP